MAEEPPVGIGVDVEREEIRAVFGRQVVHAPRVARSSAAERIAKLDALREAVLARRDRLRNALLADFRKPPEEVDLTELVPLLLEIRHAQRHVAKWMRPGRAATSLPLIGTTAEIRMEPKGVVLIISPWNYPWMLALGPLVSAIVAGNTVIIKPSEHTPHTAELLLEMISETFSPDEVAVFTGDHRTATALLELPFNHVFFTGSPAVGSIVMRAASTHLSSVTLELGGKSPTIIDESADLHAAALTIMWAKHANAGQTCVAPDYALVPEDRHDEFVDALRTADVKLRGERTDVVPQDMASIVSDKHAERIRQMIAGALRAGATCALGSADGGAGRLIPPTILTGVDWSSPIMSEEIFGPVLPVLKYRSRADVVARLRALPIPLALYVFSADPEAADFWIEHTRSGGVVVNDVAIHFANPELPFGGMQQSGIGRSHGHAGFLAFSNERTVMRQKLARPPLRRLYPPYGPQTRRFLDWLLRYAR